MKIKTPLWIALILAGWSFCQRQEQIHRVYYVAPTGSDNNPGTEDKPWRTIQKAAETLLPGDTVYIKAGVYRERVVPKNSGEPDKYIVYASYPGDTAVIDGEGLNLPEEHGLFEVLDKNYIVISGLKIMNAGPNENVGILVENSSHIIIQKNYIYNTTSSGIGVWNSKDIIIDGNEIELACNDGEQECITVAGTENFEVKNNHVHDGGPGTNGGEGIDVKDGSSNGKVYNNCVHHLNRLGIYVDAWDKHTYNIEVFQNRVYNCDGDGFALASEAGGLLENIKIYNNIAYDNQYCGIAITANGDAFQHPMKNIKVINNTLYQNGTNNWGGGIYVENPDVENIIIRNNICSKNLSFQMAVESSLEDMSVDHNLIDGYRDYEDEIRGKDYVEGDPMFADPFLRDFHLKKGSPAIDKGSSQDAPSDDFEGNPRPQGKGYDIGAFEFMGA